MALQTSGAISLNDIHVEAGGTSASAATINDADIRALIGASSGSTMDFADWDGASAAVNIQITPASRFAGKGSREHHGYETTFSLGSIQTSTPISANGATITPLTMKWIEFSGWRFEATINTGTWNTTGWTKFRVIDDNDDESDVNLERSTVNSQSVSGSSLVITWPVEDLVTYGGTVTWELT